MSDDSKRRRGGMSRYLNGGTNSLMRRAAGARQHLEQNGGWSYEHFVRLDSDFVSAVEAAFRSGRESPASASGCVRAGAGDSAPAS